MNDMNKPNKMSYGGTPTKKMKMSYGGMSTKQKMMSGGMGTKNNKSSKDYRAGGMVLSATNNTKKKS